MEKSLKGELCYDSHDIVKPCDTDFCAGNGSTSGSHIRGCVCVRYASAAITEGFVVEVTSEFSLRGPGLAGLGGA